MSVATVSQLPNKKSLKDAHFASLLQATGFTFGHYIGVTNPVDLNEDCPNAAPGTPSCPTTIVPPICTPDAEPNDPRGKETIQIFDFQVFLAQNTPGHGERKRAGAVHFHWLCALPYHELYHTAESNNSAGLPRTSERSSGSSEQPDGKSLFGFVDSSHGTGAGGLHDRDFRASWRRSMAHSATVGTIYPECVPARWPCIRFDDHD